MGQAHQTIQPLSRHLAVHGRGLRKLVGQGLTEDMRSNEGEAALHFSQFVYVLASLNHITTLETRSCSYGGVIFLFTKRFREVGVQC